MFAVTLVLQFLLVAGEEDVWDDDGSTHEDDAEQHDVGLPIAEEVVVGPAPTRVPITLIIVTIIVLCVVIIIIIRCILKICLYCPNLPTKIVNVLNIGWMKQRENFYKFRILVLWDSNNKGHKSLYLKSVVDGANVLHLVWELVSPAVDSHG